MMQTKTDGPLVVRPAASSSVSTGQLLRQSLVEVGLQWEAHFGVAPRITDAIAELDAALLVGMTEEEYCLDGATKTAVTRGRDFTHQGVRYQVTANRPSGKKGSKVTLVGQKKRYEWDKLVWLLYDQHYVLQEAWQFGVKNYKQRFCEVKRLSPDHMRLGRCLYVASDTSSKVGGTPLDLQRTELKPPASSTSVEAAKNA